MQVGQFLFFPFVVFMMMLIHCGLCSKSEISATCPLKLITVLVNGRRLPNILTIGHMDCGCGLHGKKFLIIDIMVVFSGPSIQLRSVMLGTLLWDLQYEGLENN